MTKDSIGEVLRKGAEEGVFSGAQLTVAKLGGVEQTITAGHTSTRREHPIHGETLFDIASITKAFTASAVLRLVDAGELSLEMSLRDLSSRLFKGPSGDASLAQLLAHEAGFAAWRPFFEGVELQRRGSAWAREAIFSAASNVKAEQPGERCEYSDLGFILLCGAIEERTGSSLEELIASHVCGPLELQRTAFRHVSGLNSEPDDPPETFASTEDCPWRGRVLTGEVHDDNCWTMGGVSGHAGLFSTSREVAGLGLAWLGAFGEGKWLRPRIAAEAVMKRTLGRGLGWDTLTVGASSAGSFMSPATFGHLGFTGCSLWVDPERKVSISLLTNRVHPSRHNDAIRRFRPIIHNHVMESLALLGES